ncbi:unnamed protein product [Didymodactylos carnosus]|uniref:Uncharacterized protein n=1 Tax=Didymodactylos carnosus TaxID=1234261 RepID=A0A815B3V5_9BILA|nr:unnamed protein product [Didymodactylos carnosus]CAF1273501.1 unnamed protein product [Didymodactylos carnosus]CAF4048861.1 unnamed protein product [Didymodactylos carnosus]CAF4078800.1 unnamed protein product [Didymodactylos carnosus]
MACQVRTGGGGVQPKFESVLLYKDGVKRTNIQLSEISPGTGVIMKSTNGDICNMINRTMIAKFICDKTIKNPTTMKIAELPPCTFNIEIRAAQACPGGGGLSGGSIFIILLIVLLFVYCVGGVVFRRFIQGVHGIQAVPHLPFWQQLPILVKEGSSWTLSKVKGKASPSAGGYQSV